MAIALDTVTEGSDAGTATTCTWSHTCTGSNLILVVGVYWRSQSDNSVSGVTYNGVAMTSMSTKQRANGSFGGAYPTAVQLWYLAAPATGAHDVVVTISAGCDGPGPLFVGNSISYTGAQQSSSPTIPSGGSVNSNSGASSITGTVVVSESNSWVVGIAADNTGVLSGGGMGTGTFRIATTNAVLADSGGTVGTGSQSLVWNEAGQTTSDQAATVASFAPSAAVGPANLKTYNTNAAANIKTIDTNAIANVKTLNTNA